MLCSRRYVSEPGGSSGAYEAGADFHVTYQVDNGDTQILKLLAEKGRPDLTARDENGQTVAEMIEERGLIEEEKILLGGRTPSPKMTEAMSNLRDFVKQK